jgi:predicted nucleotidyltransferase|uniref:nucleotidyltransferase domain-containing protein n=1 Tax=Orrella sp. TaxID=1921583 RepID=UPI004047E902
MNTGLNTQTTLKIFSVFKRFPQVEKAILYGSRAMGTHKPGSDIDISLIGKDLTQELVWKILDALDDTLLPHVFDLSLFETLDNLELKEHILRVGIIFYEADSIK